LPSKVSHEVTQKWLQVTYALKHCVLLGLIDDQQGYELFNIVSGGESNEKQWNSIKPKGDVTVATIIHYAQEKGYKLNRYGYALNKTKEQIETEIISDYKTITVKDAKRKVIKTSTMIDLLQ